ncbi:SDR family oxidoreductase [Sulfurospirillum deleyianum]|uniref:Short-chain dehydrogenase/reductase SDR n=1 Tax=Sulfurospirillum deleyianum (strain ATCC 51133 / DSM 6946 / 5175) TaxID=525898 RepID=D1B4K4_SULD5|nr:SDR family oxidoreductase [Sulfurospirillum deleyianum]ACZ13024.1 short-chain dehydrogenase/reductase SDR [Sulfurospirillum deleyianum DSM 6946]
MKTVLMSGGSSGIGKAIKNILTCNEYEVFNIGRNEAEIVCDLRDTEALEKKVKAWLKSHEVDVLINCAGVGVFDPHETISPSKIKNLIDINLTAPIILSSLCLRSLQKQSGHIINITSIEATRHAKYSALYTATKSGLRDFGHCLFEEVRKSGVRVTSINPDMTQTPFFDALHFKPSEDESTHLLPETIAQSVWDVLHVNGVITDLSIRPQKVGIAKK